MSSNKCCRCCQSLARVLVLIRDNCPCHFAVLFAHVFLLAWLRPAIAIAYGLCLLLVTWASSEHLVAVNDKYESQPLLPSQSNKPAQTAEVAAVRVDYCRLCIFACFYPCYHTRLERAHNHCRAIFLFAVAVSLLEITDLALDAEPFYRSTPYETVASRLGIFCGWLVVSFFILELWIASMLYGVPPAQKKTNKDNGDIQMAVVSIAIPQKKEPEPPVVVVAAAATATAPPPPQPQPQTKSRPKAQQQATKSFVYQMKR